MNRLSVSYSTWRSVASLHSLTVYEKVVATDTARVWVGTRDLMYLTDVVPSDWADYTAAFPTRTTVQGEDDAVALILNFASVLNKLNRDGTMVVQPVTLEEGQWHYWHGRGDSAVALKAGDKFNLTNDGTGTDGKVIVSWGYRDPVWMAGGILKYKDADINDTVNFVIYAPATPITANVTNEGNCHLLYGVLIPAAGDGAYDVDLAQAVPVPTQSGTGGYWDYAIATDMMGAGVTTPSATPGQAPYHLIPARFDLVNFVGEEQLLGDGESWYEPQNIRVSLCMPEWRFECTSYVDNTVAHTVKMVWRVLVSRWWTTV